jgi:glutathione S-transferase
VSIDGESSAIKKSSETMTIRLHGSKLSTCTQRVMLVLNELELPYEFVAVDMGKGEHKVNRSVL